MNESRNTDVPEAFQASGSSPKIAFVVDWLEDSYQSEVLDGAARECRAQGASLVALLGGVVGAEHAHGQRRNVLYELLTEDQYDGIVVMSGTLANAQGVDVMETLCPTFPRERVCNIAIEIPGSSSVLIGNTRGMRRMIEHMIAVHDYRRIAFIRGPQQNPEAEARYAAYTDVLDAHRIPLDPLLVLDGDFLWESGTAAVKTLFDERGLKPDDIDVIVAADDLMALAALEELGRRGVRVPNQVAIAGFDDIEDARYSSPPLSSVHQPLVEQGAEAVRLVMRAIAGDADDAPLVLDTTSCFRRSCGCTAEDPGYLTARPKAESRLSLRASVLRRRELIVAEVNRAAVELFELGFDGWSDELFEALLLVLDDDEEAFREAFDLLLGRIVEANGEAAAGHRIITALRRQLSVCAGDDPGQIRQVEGLLHDVRILTSDAVERVQAMRRIRLSHFSRALADVSSILSAAPTQATLNELIATQLPRIGFPTCYLCRYVGETTKEAELIGAVQDGTPINASLLGKRFSSQYLSPLPLFDSPKALVVEPLFSEEKALGFALLSKERVPGYMYEVVRKLLSLAVSQRN